MRKPRIGRLMSGGRLAALLLLLALVGLRFWDPAPLETARHQVFDLYQMIEPRVAEAYPVTIVDIDEKALAEVGQWPWSRAKVADLVDRLSAAGAAAIGFDVLFSEPDRLSPSRIARDVPELAARTGLDPKSWPDNDQTLAAAISRARVVVGQAGQPASSGPKAEGNHPTTSIATVGGDPRGNLIAFPRLLRNLPAIEVAAAGRGLVTVQPERDGIIRRVPVVALADDAIVPAFATDLLRVATGGTSLVVKSDEAGVRSLVVGGGEIATDRDAQVWLHFSRHDGRRFLSAADVLQGRPVADRIKDKIVLVGTSSVGLFDMRSTPTERVVPGVEIHAQLIESVLGQALLARPNYALGAEVSLSLLIGLAMLVAVPMLGAMATLFAGMTLSAVLVGVSWYLFKEHRILLDVSFPLLSSAVVFLLLTFVNYAREEQRRAQIRSAFRQYLSADLVEQLIREPDRLKLGGETRAMSILFSDVRGFTAIAESFKSNPQGLTALMNRLLTPLSKAVIENRGTIDKYIGDAIMAFWNAPLDDADHAIHACEAALEIVRRLDALNAERRAEGEAAGQTAVDMQIGVGVSTGTSVVGNMGSDIRFDYSVLGDSVNLASRIEKLTALYGVRILICPETARQCEGRFAILEIDDVRVRGRVDSIVVHALLGGSELLRESHFRAFRGSFREYLGYVRAGDIKEARLTLARARKNCEISELATALDLHVERLAGAEGRSEAQV